MSVLDPFREEVASAIMTPCLVARDRTGRSLFISDYPRRLPQHEATHIDTALRRLGWQVDRGDDSLARLDWTPARYAGYFDALPHASLPAPREDTFLLWGVAGALLRHDTPAHKQDISVLRQTLLLVDTGQIRQLHTLLSRALALALRQKTPPPSAAAKLLIAQNLL